MPTVLHHPERRKFELPTEAGTAWIDYEIQGDTMILHHSEVPDSLRGQGIGSLLVTQTMDQIAREGKYRVRPTCGYIRSIVRSEGKWNDLLASA